MYIYIHVYIHTCVTIHTYSMCTHIYIHTYIHTYTHTYIHTYIQYTYIHIHTHRPTYIHIDLYTYIQRRRNMFWSGGGTGVRGHLTYKKRANQVQHKQQVIYSKHAVHLQLLIKSPIAINFKGKKVKTIFVFWNEHLKQWFPTGGSRPPRVATQRLGTTDLEAYIVVTYLVYFSHEFINLYLNFPKKCIRRSFLLKNSLAMFYLLGHVPHFPDGYPADEILGVDLTASTGS